MIEEILDQIKRKSTLFRLLVIFVLAASLGIFSTRGWARSHFETVADLLEIQHGYEGVSVGYSGFGSLLITLVERRGTFFVKKLNITRDHEILQREFAPPSRLKYPDAWPAHLSLARILDDRHVRVELIMNSWVLALVFFASLGTAGSWLIGLAWLELLNREKIEIAISEKMAAQARQVAHDIRSPLAALEVASADAAQLPDAQRLLIHSAVGRIRDIANSLLDRQRALSPTLEAAASPQRLSPLIDPVINEKLLQFRSQPHIKIEFRLDPSSHGLFASVAPIEFKRILSNLVNNAVEALGDGTGTVQVSLSASDGFARVSVRDDGKGIPPEMLAKLGRRGETHGKAGGSGLGLYHARTTAESWGGRLELASKIGKGTTVTLILPSAPERLAPEPGRERYDAVLIDDDPLARLTWKTAAARAGKKFHGFASAGEFLAMVESIDRSTPVYIDAELGDGVKGDLESVKIHGLGFRDIFLATGHPPETFTGLKHLRGVVGKEAPWI